MASGLHGEIVGDILRLARDEEWPVGCAVGEKPLAGRLGVSRTPVRRALVELSERGLLSREPGLGFKLGQRIDAHVVERFARTKAAGGELYQQILSERASGRLARDVTENAMLAHLGAARGDLRRALLRLAAEGVVERQRGHGWRFTESLDTPQAIRESYAFRLAVETAALGEPGYRVDMAALAKLKASHENLMRKPASEVSPEMWFEVNSVFHETLASWSQNRFFLQAVKRQNALRRMHQFVDFAQLTPEQVAQSCKDHLAILAALARDDRAAATTLLAEHLRTAAEDWDAPAAAV
jgi:DNA-binding GntR family transcriptional regulator